MLLTTEATHLLWAIAVFLFNLFKKKILGPLLNDFSFIAEKEKMIKEIKLIEDRCIQYIL